MSSNEPEPAVGARRQEAPDSAAAERDALRRDLMEFIGPNADRFLQVRDLFGTREMVNGKRKFVANMCIPMFLIPFPWLMYRKMYLEAALLLLIPILLGIILPDLLGTGSIGAAVVLALHVKSWYLSRAKRKIKRISEQATSVDERRELIQKAGGVSLPAGVIGGAIYVSLIGLAILATDAGT
jgi:hypothetical protein